MHFTVRVVVILAFCTAACLASTQPYDTVTHKVKFAFTHNGRGIGSVILALYGNAAPRTVRNFITFAGEGFWGLWYANTEIHRVINGYLIQGGDVENRRGRGSLSIYGVYFDDEPFIFNHTGAGNLSMANAGKNTNGAQFFIVLQAVPNLDGSHVVFGTVIKGLEVVRKIAKVKADSWNHPLHPVVITNCTVKEYHKLPRQAYVGKSWN